MGPSKTISKSKKRKGFGHDFDDLPLKRQVINLFSQDASYNSKGRRCRPLLL